jgi:hypothetical protein
MTDQSAFPSPPPSHFDFDFIAPARVFTGEDAAGYEQLLARVCATLQPRDVIEQIWARDVVDLVWEILRLRRMKTEYMNEAASDGVGIVLDKRRGLLRAGANAQETAQRWASGDSTAR